MQPADAGAGIEGGDVEAGAVAVRSFEAVARDARIDEAGVDRLQALVVEAGALEAAGADIGDENVGVLHEALHGFDALGLRGVDGEALLAAIVEFEDRRALEVIGADILHGVAHGAAREGLDLHDLRAPVGKDAARAGRGDVGGHFNDLDALEHGFRSPFYIFWS